MKNKTTILVLIATFLTLGNGCKENETKNSKPKEGWSFSFYISDSAGNNLLPYELPDSPIVNPNSFIASPVISSNTFSFGHGIDKKTGRTFRFGDKLDGIFISDYYIDTLYRVRFCLENNCDTISFRLWAFETETERREIDYISGAGKVSCSAKWAIFRGDTIFDLSCANFPLIVK